MSFPERCREKLIAKIIKKYKIFGPRNLTAFRELYEEARRDGYVEGISRGKLDSVERSEEQKKVYIKHLAYLASCEK